MEPGLHDRRRPYSAECMKRVQWNTQGRFAGEERRREGRGKRGRGSGPEVEISQSVRAGNGRDGVRCAGLSVVALVSQPPSAAPPRPTGATPAGTVQGVRTDSSQRPSNDAANLAVRTPRVSSPATPTEAIGRRRTGAGGGVNGRGDSQHGSPVVLSANLSAGPLTTNDRAPPGALPCVRRGDATRGAAAPAARRVRRIRRVFFPRLRPDRRTTPSSL